MTPYEVFSVGSVIAGAGALAFSIWAKRQHDNAFAEQARLQVRLEAAQAAQAVIAEQEEALARLVEEIAARDAVAQGARSVGKTPGRAPKTSASIGPSLVPQKIEASGRDADRRLGAEIERMSAGGIVDVTSGLFSSAVQVGAIQAADLLSIAKKADPKGAATYRAGETASFSEVSLTGPTRARARRARAAKAKPSDTLRQE